MPTISNPIFSADQRTYPELWNAPGSSLAPGTYWYRRTNARDGFFYISGRCTVTAVNAETGNVVWQTPVDGWPTSPAVDQERVYAGFTDPSTLDATLLALDRTSGEVSWSRVQGYQLQMSDVSVDEMRGLVYGAADVLRSLRAYEVDTGDVVWEAPIDHILNGPPTLGEVDTVSAVFVVTGGVDDEAGVYAFNRGRTPEGGGTLLWETSIPCDAWTSATYAGGKLYIGANDGLTYVFDANTGTWLQILGTVGDYGGSVASRVIVEMPGDLGSVMYYLTESGTIEAWNSLGTPRRIGVLSVTAEPAIISTNSQASVTATIVDEGGLPIEGRRVIFSCNAENNQGYLSPPTSLTTDELGQASVTFNSEKRTGMVTVGASTTSAQPDSASVNITVVKGGGEEPPVETGTIMGTVTDGQSGRSVRKATVKLYSGDPPVGEPIATTQTSGKAEYKFTELLPGTYTVVASKDGATGSSQGEVQADAVTVLDIQLW